ncbi:MAG: helix-turn-helix transcriptional regulator [Bacillota bacterium]
MARLSGQIEGDLPPTGTVFIGLFSEPRIHSEPAAWTSLGGAGHFALEGLPEGGSWYLHAIHCEDWIPGTPTFPSPTAMGSYGGPYGYGQPFDPAQQTPALRVHIHPAWRDLTYLPAPLQPGLPEHHRQVVGRALRYLAASGGEADWLEGLLREVHLTRSFLASLFKRATGLSLQEFRTRCLLERAKGLLITTELDVLEVALESGYSPAQLTRLFHRYLGLSPGDFRRLARRIQAPAARWPALAAQLPHLAEQRQTRVTGRVSYEGRQEGAIIYIGAFPQPVPTTYPRAWTALPAPGPYSLTIPATDGELYILAAYCRRRMRYPGDIATAFADGGFGPVPCAPGARHEVNLTLRDSDLAASFSDRWFHTFLPDGRQGSASLCQDHPIRPGRRDRL